MSQTVIGIFADRPHAEQAVKHLIDKGYDKKNVDLSAHNAASDTAYNERSAKFFNTAFDNKDEARRYNDAARTGSVVTVHTEKMESAKRAATILDEHGALNHNPKMGTGRTVIREEDKDRTDKKGTTETSAHFKDSSKTIPIIEENLEVGKREVETGGVHLRSHIVEKPIEEKLRLREEHVFVERNPVDRPASKRDFDTFKEGEARLVEHAEKPMVNKEARVVEEVRVGKETEKHTETIRDTVRKTDVEVDKLNRTDVDKDRRK